ncbi:TatD family hydrolase [Pedobacter metabolipauper]|uniref:TatD DNase family protein n=1 Tax=Pedobacter metabolipauper TaxID=425513 RepID=A0A4R6SSS7_9SPHI|nr:TatD family hydrolase [Pedobacter metabolipauper]TDQ07651.1 TatD DNase family protein [Pedobacter metabolipauper]
MVLTDTHTHLYYETDEEKQALLMQRCFDNKVERLFLPNVDIASIAKIDHLVSKYPENCFAMAGLHPCDVKEDYELVLDEICESLMDRQIYAIGEIGIDLHWDKTTLDFQKTAFTEQINWAKDLDLPIVIHCREAFDEVFEVLEKEKDEKLRGILHCFTGNLEQAQKAIDLGFYLGIGGVVTYKNAGLDEVLKSIPLANLVLETDSPYLAPLPFRGKPNESSYLVYIAEKLADIYQVDLEEIASVTTANSIRIFNV